jgi:hypothetical protein
MLGHRVRETTNTAGVGTISLGGAVGTGFRTFRDEFASGSKVFYVIANADSAANGDYEIGIGTLTHGTPDTLTRDTVLDSSNSGNKLNLSGVYSVFNDISAVYTPVDRTAESIASAATTNIGAAAGNFVHVTGSTGPITSFGTAPVAGRRVTVTFDSTPTITHGANLVLPGAANIVAAAGDVATFRADTTTKWVCEGYTKANGQPPVGGKIAQVVNFQTGAVATGTTQVPSDDTIPQQTEGDEYMTLAITPKNASSTLIVEVVWCGAHSAASVVAIVALFRDSAADAVAVVAANALINNGSFGHLTMMHKESAGSTATTTFKVRAGGNAAGTTTFNGSGGSRFFGGKIASAIKIIEVLP